jgi:two-component system sensor histidine kinase/response regulator
MLSTQKTDKILVIDDEAQYRGMMKDILDDQYTVKLAGSGEEGLALLPAFEPDMVLLDIMLPGLDGYEICRTIRKNSCYNSVKIIMVSAKLTLVERLEGYDAGADDYLTKPFDNDELNHKVRIFLHLKRIEEVDIITGYLLRRFSIEARTPLNGIISPAETLLRDCPPPDQIKRFASIILESSNRLLEFVHKTTLLCELKKGLTPQKTTGSLNTHLDGIIQARTTMASYRSIKIDINITDDILLYVDWELIEKAFGYLIENAIEHSPPSATVDIRISRRNEYVQVAIADQGEGITSNLVDKLFDTCRCMQSLANMEDCKGFSLVIVKHIVDLHNGAITAFNNPLKGSTFYLTLPLPSNMGNDVSRAVAIP